MSTHYPTKLRKSADQLWETAHHILIVLGHAGVIARSHPLVKKLTESLLEMQQHRFEYERSVKRSKRKQRTA